MKILYKSVLPKLLLTIVMLAQLTFLIYIFSILFYAQEMEFLIRWILAMSLITWGVLIPLNVGMQASISFINYLKTFIAIILLSAGITFFQNTRVSSSKWKINYVAKQVKKEVTKSVAQKNNNK